MEWSHITPLVNPGRRLPEGPVKLPVRRRITFLQATLLVSFLMHAVGLFGWSLAPPVSAASETRDGNTFIVNMVEYKEPAPLAVAAAAPAPQAPPPASSGPRVGYAPGYIGVIDKPTPAAPKPHEQPRNRTQPGIIDVPAPPPPNPQQNRAPEPMPSPVASSGPPKPDPTPSPAATPMATPTPAPSPSVQPVASPTPGAPVVAQDPRADFSLRIVYHNDPRLTKRGGNGLDLAQMSQLPDVKPVLSNVPKQVLPLNDAGRYGLKAMNLVRATVRVAVDTKKDSIAPLVPPSKIQVTDITIDGKAVVGATRDQLLLFIQDGVSATQWLPGSSKGVWADHSEQVFEVEIVQVSDDTAMSPPTSRAP